MFKTALILILLLITIGLSAIPRIAYIGASAVLPGSGELLLGRETRAGFFLTADILALTGYVITDREIDLAKQNYKQYAYAYAGVPTDRDDRYYNAIQKYYSSDEFNRLQEMLARNYYLVYYYDPVSYDAYMAANTYTGDEEWEWADNDAWQKYKDLRRKHRTKKIDNSAFLGALVLNRVISVLDVVLLTRKGGSKNKQASTLYFTPLSKNGLMLNYEMGF